MTKISGLIGGMSGELTILYWRMIHQQRGGLHLALLEIVALIAQDAEGVIGGCTEIGLLLSAAGCPAPALDTTSIHAAAAVEFIFVKLHTGWIRISLHY